ncbi:MAG: 50S ribosomal protein L30 [Nitrospirae bacterium]|nr:50S ribosomal protein L30 [Nitrospirota bacterium]
MGQKSLWNGSQLTITLKRSPVGRPAPQRKFLLSLGLRRLQQTVTRPNTDQVRGLINKVKHLVEVSDS